MDQRALTAHTISHSTHLAPKDDASPGEVDHRQTASTYYQQRQQKARQAPAGAVVQRAAAGAKAHATRGRTRCHGVVTYVRGGAGAGGGGVQGAGCASALQRGSKGF